MNATSQRAAAKRKADVAILRDALERLRLAPGGPVAEIRRSGVRGVPEDCDRCLVARWLERETGLSGVRVDGRTARAGSACVVLHPEVARVVDDFDGGLLIDLEEAPTHLQPRKEAS